MKKFLFIWVLFFIALGCEKDDICVETLTPKLIIRFYDATSNTSTKLVPNLSIWSDGKDSIISNQTIDSIAIPLDVNSNQTFYNFKKESSIEKLVIDYDLEVVYVSRSCGFITNYNNLSISSTNNWIQEIVVTELNIKNENSAHVQIRH